ncbi:2-cysteine adaptor domain-containing protein [European chub iridovirus]|nr:2-cysteine adaptor domain-containing protein [European chub iridovirus]
MASTKTICNTFKRSGYSVNPVTKRTISPSGSVSKTMQNVCSRRSYCRSYNANPSVNPWTGKPLTNNSSLHTTIRNLCNSRSSPTRRQIVTKRKSPTRQKPFQQNLDYQRQWANSSPGSKLPFKRAACARYVMERDINPFTDKPLTKYSPLADALYRECEDKQIKNIECNEFERNPHRNPETGRAIKANGPTSRSFKRRCDGWKSHPVQSLKMMPSSPSSSSPVTPLRSTSLSPSSSPRTVVTFNPQVASTPFHSVFPGRSPVRSRVDTLRRYMGSQQAPSS